MINNKRLNNKAMVGDILNRQSSLTKLIPTSAQVFSALCFMLIGAALSLVYFSPKFAFTCLYHSDSGLDSVKQRSSNLVISAKQDTIPVNTTALFNAGAANSLFISAARIGGLGNLLFQYATAYGIARSLGKRVHLDASSELLRHFPAISKYAETTLADSAVLNRRTVVDPKTCGFVPSVVEQSQAPYNIVMSGYFQSWRYFDAYRDEILTQLRFNDEIQAETDKLLANVHAKVLQSFSHSSGETAQSASKPKSLVWVAVHVRRGDMLTPKFAPHGFAVATAEYLQRAAAYFVRKYREAGRAVVFLVFSEDLNWSKENFVISDAHSHNHNNTHYTNDSSRGQPQPQQQQLSGVHVEYVYNTRRELDISMMSRCNATIMTVGTFGWWSAYLAGGETFYYAYPYRPGSAFAAQYEMDDFYLPKWRLMF